ncbi:MASE4 domain-containing protein [Sneathiella sp. HT1-7]|uniref:MASE4 domain-containing protein n=1 Tax=Sneathiella sp. HT1-7 TaxID=2887192 RepID=UPI001D159AC4|nr:MASE4 domain-containing protein [Sneathiella sp. HT1-7]MCC3306216.1 MASE4 domain-containing protein [Sneathiella sp. HT1-7]
MSLMGTTEDDVRSFLISLVPPGRHQTNLAVFTVIMLICVLVLTLPFAHIYLSHTEVFVPAYAAAVFVNELITTTLLLVLYSVQRSTAVLALSMGYLFSGLLIIPWAVTFPDVFAQLRLPDTGLQSTVWIAISRRLGFPLFILAYLMIRDDALSIRKPFHRVRRAIIGSITGISFLVGGICLIVFTSDDALPEIMRDARNISSLWQYVPATALLLYAICLITLWRRRRSLLDLWLMVVLCTLIFEVILLSYLGGGLRLSVGWWSGRFFGFVSATVILLVLLSETTLLYARLARSIAAERRTRESRLTAMEALSATIAHEINQPLASMITNADAGVRWLQKSKPDLEETRTALERIVRDGHRAGKVVESVRSMFRKGTQERGPVDLNGLIAEVLRCSQSEVTIGHVTLQTEVDKQLPLVTGNQIQLQQVVWNLISNAIDSMRPVTDRARVLRVSCKRQNRDAVLFSIEDTGIGMTLDDKNQIFEPFYTTKSDGMGMGLMFCRAIIESHGGQLWMKENIPHGTIFLFTLPGADEILPDMRAST